MLPAALPDGLPNIARARLPAVYEDAKTALTECSRIDECQDWADKAEALASYAKQAQDDELRRMADRIQARAIRRCGELLQAIKAATGSHLPNVKKDGAVPLGRIQAAEDAGLSERQRKTAVRIARVPEPEFEAAIEREEPTTVTALAERGTQPRVDHLNGRDPADFREATALLGLLRHIERHSEEIDLAAAIRGLAPREIEAAVRALAAVEEWIGAVTRHLEG